jgi:hypothetical protein
VSAGRIRDSKPPNANTMGTRAKVIVTKNTDTSWGAAPSGTSTSGPAVSRACPEAFATAVARKYRLTDSVWPTLERGIVPNARRTERGCRLFAASHQSATKTGPTGKVQANACVVGMASATGTATASRVSDSVPVAIPYAVNRSAPARRPRIDMNAPYVRTVRAVTSGSTPDSSWKSGTRHTHEAAPSAAAVPAVTHTIRRADGARPWRATSRAK